MHPLISIALPCYNAEETLMSTLYSILRQNYSNWELLAMDDGSTDGTVELLHSFDDTRIRVITDGMHKGRSYRLNQASRLAKGEYYARMDADDIMFPRRLERQIDFLQRHKEVDLLGTGLVSIGKNQDIQGCRFTPKRVNTPSRILQGEVLYHPTVMGLTSWFLEHPYDEECSYSEDFALWVKSAENLSIANLQEPLLFYREKGFFTYEKYRGRRRETRKAIQSYGPRSVGQIKTQQLLLRRLAKDFIYALFYHIGKWDKVLVLPNRSVAPGEASHYSKMLVDISRLPY